MEPVFSISTVPVPDDFPYNPNADSPFRVINPVFTALLLAAPEVIAYIPTAFSPIVI